MLEGWRLGGISWFFDYVCPEVSPREKTVNPKRNALGCEIV